MSELSLIEKIKSVVNQSPAVITGIGDDTAILERPAGPLLFAADMLMDGTHFKLSEIAPELAGRKALAVNLSDIAAMAGTPLAVTVSLAIPKNMNEKVSLAVMHGLNELACQFGVAVCGGDTNVWDHPFVIGVTIIGAAHPKGSVLRSGAKAGDHIFVTGPLGGTISGKHLSFVPRVREATWLKEHYALNSMIDLSDGLAKDLRHILEQSQRGAVLSEDQIPRNDNCSLENAMCGGEDFELCFTLPASESAKLATDQSYPGGRLYKIGIITSEPGLRFADGRSVLWHGYEHGINPVMKETST